MSVKLRYTVGARTFFQSYQRYGSRPLAALANTTGNGGMQFNKTISRFHEDGFAVVQDLGGVAVFVGPPRTGTIALHQLESPDEVALVLELLQAV